MVNKITTPPTQNEVIDKINELVDGKQDNLVSGTNIKTINNIPILGSGNIDIQGGGSITVDSALSTTSTNPVQNKVITTALSGKANSADLATVATSGSYTDLNNKPTIPTVNNATLTIQKNGSNVATFTANASSNVTANISVPTTTASVISGSLAALTSGGAYANLVRRKPTSAATGSASQGVYVDAKGQVQTCTAVTSTYAATGKAPVNGVAVSNAIATKQDTLVSGTNIKTINGTSLLGSGDIVIQSAPNLYNRNIGEIITSSIPLTDAGLHLLDGSLIQGGGIYDDFVQYIAGLVNTYPQCFCSEAEWQQSVNTYGVCGKFVYSNNSVRLPKITGFVEGTIDSNALGDLVEAGLPNITGTNTKTTANWEDVSGCFTNIGTGNTCSIAGSTSGHFWGEYNFDASRSSSIYGNSNTVQPQAIKVFYYIVVANSTKTNIEVDIDEIVTDLNGKADVDLSNCTKPHIVETYVNGTSWYRVYSDGWCEQAGEITIQAQGANTGLGTTVTFLKPYINTNYYVAPITYITDGVNTTGLRNNYTDKNTTSMNISTYSTTAIINSYRVAWYTCGYIS